MNIDTLVSELEKDHQKELDKVRKDLTFENWKDRQEHLEFVKSVWACMTIIDPWYVGLFDSCPDEKTILSRLKDLFKELKDDRKIINKTAEIFIEALNERFRDEEIPIIAKKMVEAKETAEDERQEAEDSRREAVEKNLEILVDKKLDLDRTVTAISRSSEETDKAIKESEKIVEKVKSEQLEKEKK